jgi:formylmethanofuran dehydrogenase subunit B
MTAPDAVRIVLPFCGLPCAETALTFENGRVVEARGGCAVCRDAALALRFDGDPLISGRGATLDEALDRAAARIRQARRPFLYGLAASPVGTARLAARLAARLDAAIDVEGGDLLGPEIEAVAATGQVTATFGEIRAAADLVILWRCDPRSTHPDFLRPATPRGARRIIAVPPCVRGAGDLVLPIPDGRDVEALQTLRSLVNGRPVAAAPEELRRAAAAIGAAHRVAILWNPRLPAEEGSGRATAPAHAAALAAGFAALTLDPRSRPRIAAKALAPAQITGGVAGLLSATGYPRAIGFSGGRPVCDPVRFGAGRMLRGGADLLIAVEPLRPMPDGTACPTLLLGSRLPEDWPEPEVLLPVVPPALHDGLFLRSDGVPMDRPRLRPAGLDPVLGARPGEARVLEALLERLA